MRAGRRTRGPGGLFVNGQRKSSDALDGVEYQVALLELP